MIRVILIWFLLFSVITIGLHSWRHWVKKEIMRDGFIITLQAMAGATIAAAILALIVMVF